MNLALKVIQFQLIRVIKLLKSLILRNRYLAKLLNKKSFGLNNLDQKIITIIGTKPGYFIELGANDGITQSNTKALELFYGWKGLLIEPIPRLARECRRNRNRKSQVVNGACVSFSYTGDTIRMAYSGLMSILLEGKNDFVDPLEHAKQGSKYLRENESVIEIEVPARTLQDILTSVKAPPIIDLFSLDVEGAEFEVLEGIDFDSYQFRWIVIETRNPSQMQEFLASKGYQLAETLSHHDYIYRNVNLS